ncbi:MAG: hypothetical protein JST54_13030 [Deltaproteobacteria bacterium]|nr:hypothetical protein [Deltaproteobacteria bacterium]
MRWAAFSVAVVGVLGAQVARAETIVKPLVELGTEARYDTDPYLNGNQEVFSKISPKLGLTAANEELKLDAWYAADALYKAVQQVPELDHRAAFDIKDQLTHRLAVRGDVEAWRVQDPTSLPRLGLAAIPVPIFYSTGGAGLTYQLSPRSSVLLDDRQEVAKIDQAGLPLSLTQAPSASYQYKLGARGTVGVTYRYQAFIAVPDVVGQTHTGLLTWDHQLSEKWHAYAKGGPLAWVDGTQRGATSVVPVGEAGITWAGELSEIDLIGGHDLLGSAGYAAAVWADYAELAVAWHPWRKLNLWLGSGAFRNGLAPDGPTTVQGYSIGGGLGWAFTREISGHLQAQRIQQQDINTGAAQLVNVDRNIFGVQLTWAPEFAPKHI